MWLYGSGFPKSMSLGKVIEGKLVLGSANVKDIKKLDGKKEIVGGGWNSNEVEQGKRQIEYEQVKTEVKYQTELGKQWQGWGTALKPSFEPIIVARKPFKGSLVDNIIKNGVGGINIDECRVETNEEMKSCKRGSGVFSETANGKITGWNKEDYNGDYQPNNLGRFPSNTILTYDETDFDEVCGGFPDTKGDKRETKYINNPGTSWKNSSSKIRRSYYNDNGGSASRYFYCAKASKKDRDEGLDEFTEKATRVLNATNPELKIKDDVSNRFITVKKNIHPTVKPTNLMQYLIRLVTPNGGTILDPFNGSGSTGKAVMYENLERNKNYKYIGIELTEEYLPISKARIEYVCNQEKQFTIDDFVKE